MARFFVCLAILTTILCTLTLGGARYGYFDKPSFFVQTVVFVIFTTSLLFVYLYRFNKPDLFTQLYLLSMVVKFIAFLAYCLLIILKDRAGALENIVFFLIAYFSFTALEVGFLYAKISRENKP